MSEQKYQKQPNRSEQKREFQKQRFNTDFLKMPIIKSGAGIELKGNYGEQELEAMCKNPRQSAELIRYLIKFIESL
jgi:hypothetical protein